MAKKSNGIREVLDNIKKGNFANVYLLIGDEPYYLDCIVDALEANVVEESDRDFNVHSFYGQEIDIPTVIATAQQFPVMADRRLVMVKESQALTNAKSELNGLAEYLKRPCKTSVLVIVYKGEKLDANSALMKAAAATDTVVVKSPKLRDYELAVPVKDYCNSKRISIDEKSVNMLCEYCGADLSKLFGEIDKLIVAAGKGNLRITSELIEKNIGVSKEFNNFELSDALSNKNYDKTLRIIHYFKSNPSKNSTVSTVGILFNFFSKVVIAQFLPDKSDNALMTALQMKNVYQLRNFRIAMANYSARQAVGVIHALREFDIKSKGVDSFQNEFELLKDLIFRIFTLR